MASWIVFKVNKIDEDMVELEFTLKRPMKPEELRLVIPPPIPVGKVLLISGRGPIWLYAYLVHHYVHLAKAIATYDPKIPGYIVVASHSEDYRPGDVIKHETIMEAM